MWHLIKIYQCIFGNTVHKTYQTQVVNFFPDPCCSVMIASLRFFFLLRSSTHLMSTKFKEQMIMTTLHHHQTYYTTFKAS